jgi:hypothetical protein
MTKQKQMNLPCSIPPTPGMKDKQNLGATIRRGYLLSETPVFVRAGTILPGQGKTTRVTPGSYRNRASTRSAWPCARRPARCSRRQWRNSGNRKLTRQDPTRETHE